MRTDFFKIALFFAISFFPLFVSAQEHFSFPIQELGGCTNKEECRVYCDLPVNIPACADFAEKQGIITDKSVVVAKQFSQAILSSETPGACASTKECILYCDNIGHIEECLSFAAELNLNTQIVDAAKRVLGYLKTGGELPGGCSSKDSCLSYCLMPEHVSECVGFAMISRGTVANVLNENIEATTTADMNESIKKTGEELQVSDTISETIPVPEAGGGAGESALPPDAVVAPEVFHFASFPEETALCLKERLGERAEEDVVEGIISTDELRTAVESCVLEALSENGMISVDDLLQDSSPTSMSPLKNFAQNMLAMPIRVADHILRMLKLKH